MKKSILFLALIALTISFQTLDSTQESDEVMEIVDNIIKVEMPFDEDLGRQLCAFAMNSYCAKRKITKWKCGKGCKTYPHMTDVTVVHNGILKNNQMFVGYYTSTNSIIIAWKGTITIRNWLEDFDFFKVKYPYCEGCEVHQGFFETYNTMQDGFWAAFNGLRLKYPGAKVMLTGHSLGAALSTFNAADLVNHGINDFTWYNYGSPRCGNSAFAHWLQGVITQRVYRVTHSRDPVPHLPPESFGFEHLAEEVFYPHGSKPDDEHILCSTTNGEDPNCSDKYLLDTDVLDHVWYMGWDFVKNISLCLL